MPAMAPTPSPFLTDANAGELEPDGEDDDDVEDAEDADELLDDALDEAAEPADDGVRDDTADETDETAETTAADEIDEADETAGVGVIDEVVLNSVLEMLLKMADDGGVDVEVDAGAAGGVTVLVVTLGGGFDDELGGVDVDLGACEVVGCGLAAAVVGAGVAARIEVATIVS